MPRKKKTAEEYATQFKHVGDGQMSEGAKIMTYKSGRFSVEMEDTQYIVKAMQYRLYDAGKEVASTKDFSKRWLIEEIEKCLTN